MNQLRRSISSLNSQIFIKSITLLWENTLRQSKQNMYHL